MKKILLLVVATLGLVAPKVNAITVDDLDGKICLQYFYGNFAQQTLGNNTCAGWFEKIDDETVAIHGFKGYYSVGFTLKNNKLSTTTVVYQRGDYYNITWYDPDETRYILFNKVKGYTAYPNGYPGAGYKINNSDATLSSSAYAQHPSKNCGYFHFAPESGSNNAPFAYEEYYESNDVRIDRWVYHGMYLFVVEPNALGIRDNDPDKDYALRYEIDGNTINFFNLNNFGAKYTNTYSTNNPSVKVDLTISTTFDSNGNFTIPGQIVGGMKSAAFYGHIEYGGVLGYWFSTEPVGADHYNYYLGSDVNKGNITGHITLDGIDHYRFTNNNHWAYDEEIPGSHLRTLGGPVLEINKMVYYDNLEEEIVSNPTKTIIHNFGNDVTHKVALTIDKAGYGEVAWTEDDILWVKGGIDYSKVENAQYVDHYELHLVPGSVTEVAALSNDPNLGIKGGMNISDTKYWTGYNPDRVRTLAVGEPNDDEILENSNGLFNRFVTETQMREAGVNPNKAGNYTVYLKTFYKDETGLTPTFHALTVLEDTRATGVENIVADNTDNDAPAVYYNLNGVEMNGDNLTPGIYIRRQGKTATKVVIK